MIRPKKSLVEKGFEHTFRLLTDFDDVRESHTGREVEADGLEDKTLYCQQSLSVALHHL